MIARIRFKFWYRLGIAGSAAKTLSRPSDLLFGQPVTSPRQQTPSFGANSAGGPRQLSKGVSINDNP
jgi:hypothetical protein